MVMPKGNRGSGQVRKIQRLFKVVERLQTGRRHSAAELAHLCSCSVRTTFRDIKLLTDAGLPIMHDDSRQGYWIPTERAFPPRRRSTSRRPSAFSWPATSSESGSPFSARRATRLKLLGHLSAEARSELKDIGDTIQIHLGAMVKAEPVESIFEVLFDGLSSRTKVRVALRQPRRTAADFDARLSLRDLFRRAGLVSGGAVVGPPFGPHLQSLADPDAAGTSDPFTIPPRFTIARFLGNAWNMIPTAAKDVKIAIRFLPPRAADVEQVRWHKTQETWWNDDGSLHFEATVSGLAEVTSWILGYGQHAQVLQPPAAAAGDCGACGNMLAALLTSAAPTGSRGTLVGSAQGNAPLPAGGLAVERCLKE